ncbi:MAG: hypothetical protein AB8G11_01960 [Saprospiraceae bacterium]
MSKKSTFDEVEPVLYIISGYLALCAFNKEWINPLEIFNSEEETFWSILFFFLIMFIIGGLVTKLIVKPIYLTIRTFGFTFMETFQRIKYENFFYWLISLPFRLTFLPLIRSILTIIAGGENAFDSSIKRMRIETLERMRNRIQEDIPFAEGEKLKELNRELTRIENDLYEIRNR